VDQLQESLESYSALPASCQHPERGEMEGGKEGGKVGKREVEEEIYIKTLVSNNSN